MLIRNLFGVLAPLIERLAQADLAGLLSTEGAVLSLTQEGGERLAGYIQSGIGMVEIYVASQAGHQDTGGPSHLDELIAGASPIPMTTGWDPVSR